MAECHRQLVNLAVRVGVRCGRTRDHRLHASHNEIVDVPAGGFGGAVAGEMEAELDGLADVPRQVHRYLRPETERKACPSVTIIDKAVNGCVIVSRLTSKKLIVI